MSNIWEFLLQTILTSITAALILVMKQILADKLSPRWQYGIWSVLAVRILLPVNLQRSIQPSLSIRMETVKTAVERSLDSAYSSAFAPISINSGLPLFFGKPQSITDHLFLIYLSGVLISMLWFAFSYLYLRSLLRHRKPVTSSMQQKIACVCSSYSLKSCKAVSIDGLSSAFICGVFRPVLVLPADEDIDEKVLLHELLHLKYADAFQNMVWCVLRAIHWCNPFLQYTFNRIGNDMESLCDQRVLERLNGEERRAYGRILLSMANERFARAPGTTSLSNGGKNISRRITAIVRFKKYPRGMNLVSICIIIVLACPSMIGTTYTWDTSNFNPSNRQELEQSMVMTRINRCTTPAGALDTYAKGIMFENGIYIAAASSLSKQEELTEKLYRNLQTGKQPAYYLHSGLRMENLYVDNGYYIFNLQKYSDDSFKAVLAFDSKISDPGNPHDSEKDCLYNHNAVIVPVTIRCETSLNRFILQENTWVVEETGQKEIITEYDLTYAGLPEYNFGKDYEIEGTQHFTASGENGTVELTRCMTYAVGSTDGNSFLNLLGWNSFDRTAKTDAEFAFVGVNYTARYLIGEDAGTNRPKSIIGMQIVDRTADNDTPDFPDVDMTAADTGGSTGNFCSWINETVEPDWDGNLTDTEFQIQYPYDPDSGKESIPESYAIRIFFDGRPVEDFMLEKVPYLTLPYPVRR